MKNNPQYHLLILGTLFIIFIYGCLDKIEFARPSNSIDSFSIQGKLIKDDTSFVSLKIAELFNFRDKPQEIRVKNVFLLNNQGEKIEIPFGLNGFYFREFPENQTDFQIDYGIAYQVQIETFSNQMYESDFEVLYPVPEPTELKVTSKKFVQNDANVTVSIDNLLEYTVSTPIVSSIDNEVFKSYLLMEFEQVFKFTDTPAFSLGFCVSESFTSRFPKTCYVTSTPPGGFTLINGSNFTGTDIKDYPIFERAANNFIYAEGNTFILNQLSLSPTAFEYWSQVEENTTPSTTVFNNPQGNLISNFKNVNNPKERVFGYFYVSEKAVKRIFVSPEFAGLPKKVCPPQTSLPGGGIPPECCNCLENENSILEQPDWWIE